MILPRSTWQYTSQPVKGPPAVLRSIVRIAIHYTAAKRIPHDIPAYLRSIQKDYTVNRGYSIGYNYAADQVGQAWELRGLDIKCAANSGVNDTTIAILCLVDGDNPANPPMVTAIRNLVTHIRSHAPGARTIVGHRQIGSTTCPGAGLQAQVNARIFEPPPTPQIEDDVIYITMRTPSNKWALVAVDGSGTEVIGFSSEADRVALMAAYRAPEVPVSEGQWDDFLAHRDARLRHKKPNSE